MSVNTFPRVRFTEGMTPLQPLHRLSTYLGGPLIYMKRDDLTGLAGGGNKARKLEFLVADALQKGADTLIGLGATQSNHARQTAAAAARLGLKSVLLLERRLDNQPNEYYRSGNALLNRILGAQICEELPAGSDIFDAARRLEAELTNQGHTPYLIAGGGSNELGALGYVACAQEIAYQAFDIGIEPSYVVHATGSGGTQAGLVAGFCRGHATRVLGYSVRFEAEKMSSIVRDIAARTTSLLGAAEVPAEFIEVDDRFIGAGYGIPTDEMIESVRLVARLEGILLDPVYTGKAMAGLIADMAARKFSAKENIVFLHTGGSTALSAYESWF